MHLAGEDLIRRFLLHVLPKGLMRIRHYGFLANRCRQEKLAKIREVLGRPAATDDENAPALPQDGPCPNRVLIGRRRAAKSNNGLYAMNTTAYKR